MTHPVFSEGRVAVVTGAASGIGLAACRRFAELGMRVCLADIDVDELATARAAVADMARNGERDVLTVITDVAKPKALTTLKQTVYDRFGEVGLLMNNAVTRLGGDALENPENWQSAVNVNLWGVINGTQIFLPAMLAQGTPCAVVNTGSKQGITNPPGNAAYNVTKSALKTYTECLQHTLRNTEDCRITAHLLIPGWTTTGKRQHRPGAWLPDQVIDRLADGMNRGDFYILCPDNEVTPEMDRQRILWAAGDITENRPPLSRWHPDYAEAFKRFSG